MNKKENSPPDSNSSDINNVLEFFAENHEPEINPENPTQSGIYRYKKYISEQENKANGFLAMVIISSICCLFLHLWLLLSNDYFSKLIYSMVQEIPLLNHYIFFKALALTLLFPFALMMSVYYFLHMKKLQVLKTNLRQLQDIYEYKLLENKESRWRFFSQKLQELTAESAGIFFENAETYHRVSYIRKKAGLLLETGAESNNANEVQYLLSSLKELIKREQNEQKGQQRWRLVNITVIIGYIASLLFLMFYTAIYNPQLEKSEIPFFAIPLWAIVWGATGSLAAILYRFYTVKKRVNFFQESQWLIARPLIGILMSAIAYLTVQAGLIVVGNTPTDSATLSDNSRRVTSIICFLAGFSDRVYLSLIDLLIERTFGSQVENNQGTENGNNDLGQILAPVTTDNQTMTIGPLEQQSPEQKENTSPASGLNSDSILAQSPQSDATSSENSILE